MAPAFSWFLALRYLLTRWINLVGMFGIALAVWAMIVVVAVFSGFIGDTKRGIREASPHLLITELPKDADYEPRRAALAADPAVVATSPRLSHDAILYPIGGWQIAKRSDPIAAGAGSAGNNYVLLIGIDPEAEARTTGLLEWLRAGVGNHPAEPAFDPAQFRVEDPRRPFQISPDRIRRAADQLQISAANGPLLGSQQGILLGGLRLEIGDRLVAGQRVDVLSARFEKTADGFVIKKIKINTRLSGAFSTDHRFFDLGTCFIDIETLRDAKGYDPVFGAPVVSEIAVRLHNDADHAAAKARIAGLLEPMGGGKVLDWREQNATYLDAVNRERTLMKVVLFAVLVVAGFLIFATLHMMVVQKTKDIGILSSLGATSRGVAAIFVLSSLTIGMAGCALGLVTGFLSAYFLNDICALFNWRLFPQELYAIAQVPINLEPSWMLQVAAGALILSLLVAWLPARRAARLDPVRALMHE